MGRKSRNSIVGVCSAVDHVQGRARIEIRWKEQSQKEHEAFDINRRGD